MGRTAVVDAASMISASALLLNGCGNGRDSANGTGESVTVDTIKGQVRCWQIRRPSLSSIPQPVTSRQNSV